MDDLKLLNARGIRRLFCWVAIPDPTTSGRWRGAPARTWPACGSVALAAGAAALAAGRYAVADHGRAGFHVVVRYGKKQAGAVIGYNPKNQGTPSHHPLVAFAANTGDCLGMMWRPGSPHTAAGSIDCCRLRLVCGGPMLVALTIMNLFQPSRSMASSLAKPSLPPMARYRPGWRTSARKKNHTPGAAFRPTWGPRNRQCAVWPPSITNSAPVTKRASSDARNSTR
jgi:hypothetical protein